MCLVVPDETIEDSLTWPLTWQLGINPRIWIWLLQGLYYAKPIWTAFCSNDELEVNHCCGIATCPERMLDKPSHRFLETCMPFSDHAVTSRLLNHLFGHVCHERLVPTLFYAVLHGNMPLTKLICLHQVNCRKIAEGWLLSHSYFDSAFAIYLCYSMYSTVYTCT